MKKDQTPSLLAPPAGAVAAREYDHYDVEPAERPHPRDLWHILLKRKWWVIGTTVWAMFIAVLFILGMTPVYRATTVLQITQDNSGPKISDAHSQPLPRSAKEFGKFQETQYKILTSRGVAARVIEALNLQDTLEFKAIAANDPTAPPEKVKTEMIDLFLDKLVVNPVKDTYLVEVAFKSQDRALAKQVTDALAREYMQLVIDSRSQSFALVKDWLGKQLGQMADKVQASQKKLFEFGQQHDFYAMEDKDNTIVQKYIELSGLLTKAQSERMAKNAIYQQIKEKGPDAPAVTNNQLIMTLRQNLAAQTAKVAGLNRTFLPGHPEMQVEQANLAGLRGRLQEEVQRLQKTIAADYESAVKAEKFLTQALTEQKQNLANLQHNLADFHILKRDAQATEKLYKALLERMGETTVASTMVAGTVAVIDPPEAPYDPYLPRPLMFLSLSGIAGLFLGVGLSFLVEYTDDSIKSIEDVERRVQIPLLGVAPLCLDHQRNGINGELPTNIRDLASWLKNRNGQSLPTRELDLIMLKQPRSAMAEAIRHLRTSLVRSLPEGPPEVIVVASPNPREGNSTIAVNLAIALAQDGRRTVILDCDLRKPRLHEVFQADNSSGLTTCLNGDISMVEILQPTEVDNLFFIPAGPVPVNPSELLNSQSFKNLLQYLRRDFHHLIIDTPPTLGFADARVVAMHSDGVLLVAKHQATSRKAGRLARQHFAQVNARILGMVLNQVSARDIRRYALDHRDYDEYYAENQAQSPQLAHQDEGPRAPLN
jgi:polysaccharide biosynthesis transport protein